MKIRAIRDSHGFKGRYWEEGQVTDISADQEVPAHFEALEKVEVKPADAQVSTDPKKTSGFKRSK